MKNSNGPVALHPGVRGGDLNSREVRNGRSCLPECMCKFLGLFLRSGDQYRSALEKGGCLTRWLRVEFCGHASTICTSLGVPARISERILSPPPLSNVLASAVASLSASDGSP